MTESLSIDSDSLIHPYDSFASSNLINIQNLVIDCRKMPLHSGHLWPNIITTDECENLAVILSKVSEDDRHKMKLYLWIRHMIDWFVPGYLISSIDHWEEPTSISKHSTYLLFNLGDILSLRSHANHYTIQVPSNSMMLIHTNTQIYSLDLTSEVSVVSVKLKSVANSKMIV